MKLSVVSTLYQSSAYIEEFLQRISNTAQQFAGDSYEIILVNDGSPDESLNIAIKYSAEDQHIIVVDLSRNFGHHKAMMTGMSHANGEHIFLIDSDLEENPEWLIEFSEQLDADKSDVVYGVQKKRKGGLFERISGILFYKFFKNITGMTFPDNIVTARLMTRRYVNALLLHEEREVFILGLCYLTGFEQSSRLISKNSSSQTTYTLSKKFSLAMHAITSFSNAPLKWVFKIGLIIATLSGMYVCYLIFNWVVFTKPVPGWTSLMASIWLLGGMIISFIGIVGIYLSKIYSETKRRPLTIVRNIYRCEK